MNRDIIFVIIVIGLFFSGVGYVLIWSYNQPPEEIFIGRGVINDIEIYQGDYSGDHRTKIVFENKTIFIPALPPAKTIVLGECYDITFVKWQFDGRKGFNWDICEVE